MHTAEEAGQAAQTAQPTCASHAAKVGQTDGPADRVAEAVGERVADGVSVITTEPDGDDDTEGDGADVALDTADELAVAVDEEDAELEAVDDTESDGADVALVAADELAVAVDEEDAVLEAVVVAVGDDVLVAVAVGITHRLEPTSAGAPAWAGPETMYAPDPQTSTIISPAGPITGDERIQEGKPPTSQMTLPEAASSATR